MLHYLSGGPDGPLGPGWTISGLSTLARCAKTFAADGAAGAVTLSSSDDFCLDGKRLKVTSGFTPYCLGASTSGAITYQTEIADASNVTGCSPTSRGPTFFVVQAKDARYYEYGNTTDSRISAATLGTSAPAPYAWALDKLQDRQGNNMVFSYTGGATTLLPATIQYTATPGSGAGYGYKVTFTYATRQAGTAISKYVAGWATSLSQSIASINVTSNVDSNNNSNPVTVRQYNFDYSTSTTTGRPLLSLIQECGGPGGADCLRPTSMAYQPGVQGWSTSPAGTPVNAQYGYMPVDLNGDGIPDALYAKLSASSFQWYARIASRDSSGNVSFGGEISTGMITSASSDPTHTPSSPIPGRYTAVPGTQFLAPSGGNWICYTLAPSGSSFNSANTGIVVNGEQFALDYDADGLSDLVNVGVGSITIRKNLSASVSGPYNSAPAAASNPYNAVPAFAAPTTVYTVDPQNMGQIQSWAQSPWLAKSADFDGDGRGDLIFQESDADPNTNGRITNTVVLTSNGFGNGTTSPGNVFVTAYPSSVGFSPLGQFVDWNGDGCTDIVSQHSLYLSQCNGYFTQAGSFNIPYTTSGSPGSQTVFADWDGDGLPDLIYTDPTITGSSNVYVQRSTGSGIAAPFLVPFYVPSTQTTATQFNYGTSAAAYNIGKLQSVSKPDGYRESFTYDTSGRGSTATYTEDAVNYQFTYAYNNIGALDTLTYPTSTSSTPFQLKYVYDAYGFLNQTKDANTGKAFWTLNSTNDSSLPTNELLGNGVQVASGYTPWTNEFTTRSEGPSGSIASLQSLSYSWDLNGNLKQRQDLRQTLIETFTPDALNRLSSVTLNTAATNPTLTATYDAAGNISSKSDVGNYSYGNLSHPHAVTTAGSGSTAWSMSYDANGNMITRAGGAVTWYSYNQPNLISYAGNTTQFFYNAEHQRWKQIANYSGTIETTHYVARLLEIVTKGTVTEYRHQIPAGSSSVIYTRRTDGTSATYYATSDHLGSSDLVMDDSASVLASESFTPTGARRGSNWKGLPTTGDYSAFASTTRKGFTGQEMLDSVSLVHMNGRVYDPYLERFLSPDSAIQHLDVSQSVNPYSYAWNDPLRYVDPSGHDVMQWVGLVVGIAVGLATQQWEFTDLLINEGWGCTAWGTIEAGIVSSAMGGFAGGFTGSLVATGDVQAAYTGGLQQAFTAGLFDAVGDLGLHGFDNVLVLVLAHAAVGCASGALSGGGCGRGALAAAVGEEAAQHVPLEMDGSSPLANIVNASEVGVFGGVGARIAGGDFAIGFTQAAEDYLYNYLVHIWEPRPFSGQVGHVMVTTDDGEVVESQFPDNHRPLGNNETLSLEETVKAEGRVADHLCYVRTDAAQEQAGLAAGAIEQGRAYWMVLPAFSTVTNCSIAGDHVLAAVNPAYRDLYRPGPPSPWNIEGYLHWLSLMQKAFSDNDTGVYKIR